MKTTDIKTIDINALEWFDKVNGNSYYAAKVTINFSMQDESSFILPFDYGYGDYYQQAAMKAIKERYPFITSSHLWQLRDEFGVIIRTSKRKALKRDLKNLN